jgi:hypothetical protein
MARVRVIGVASMFVRVLVLQPMAGDVCWLSDLVSGARDDFNVS